MERGPYRYNTITRFFTYRGAVAHIEKVPEGFFGITPLRQSGSYCLHGADMLKNNMFPLAPMSSRKVKLPSPNRHLLPAALIFWVCSWAQADTFYMKSGNEIEGKTVSESVSVMTVDIGYGTVNLEKADISRIRRDTKAQRETSGKELTRNKFKSGALVPKGAEELDKLFRTVKADREKALEAKLNRAALLEKLEETENDLTDLRARYAASSAELAVADTPMENPDYNRIVFELNDLTNKIKLKEFSASQVRRQADSPEPSFQTYLTVYSRINDYIHNRWKPLMNAPRKGKEEEYFTWIREELAGMKRDFTRDSIDSEAKDRHLIVKVVINGRVSARLMVDTGATYTVLYGRAAAALKLDPKEMGKTIDLILGDGRTVQAQEVRLKSIAVGKSLVKDSSAAIMLSNNSEIDGLLGMSFLSQFGVRIDSANGKLILESLK